VKSASLGAFGLEAGEGRTAGLMTLHSFAMGLSTTFFETAASALFVTRFGATALPWVYIAAAFVNTGAGALFETARARLAFRRLMAALLVLLSATVVGLRVGLAWSDAAALVFALLVFHRVLSVLTDLEYWAVAGRLYDVRQAKRLFGPIGTGEVVARIVGSFAVPFLVATLGVPDLLSLSAGALLLCLVLLLQILPMEPAPGPGGPGRNPREEARGFPELTQDPYLRALFALAVFSVLAKYFVDFAFLAETRERTVDVKTFASFFGIFSGLTQFLSLLTRVLVSGRLLTRFGVRTGLLVLPAAHTLCTAAIPLAALSPEATAAVFWLVVANQGIYKVLKHPIDNPCFKVLYQPLPRRDRLSAQVAVEALVIPVTTGLAGVVMLLFARVGGYDPVAFAWVLLPTFLLWTLVATKAGRAYRDALVGALRGRLVPGEGLELGDEASRRVLESTLESERPADVLFALQLLERAAPERASRALSELVAHPAPAVRQAAFLRLEREGDKSRAELVSHRLQAEEAPEVRVSALSTLVALRGGEAAPLVSRFLADPDARVRTAALAALVRTDDRPGSPWRSELQRRAASPWVDDRLDAARVIATAGPGSFDDALRALLDDDDRAVRVAALQAAGRAGGPTVWPSVIAALSDRRTTGTAMAALLAGGEKVVPHLGPALETYSDPYVAVRLLRVAAARGALALVRGHLASPDAEVREAALTALAGAGHRFAAEEQPWVLAALRAEGLRAASALAAARDLGPGPELLEDALLRDADLARERALLWLSGGHDPSAIARAREGLKHAAREKRALALEVLDVTLAPEEKALVMALCAEGERRAEALAALFPSPTNTAAAHLRSLLASGSGVRPFTRAAALYATARRGLRELQGEVAAVLEEGPPPLVMKTAAFARAVLAGEAPFEQKGRRMLTIEKVITLKAARMFAEATEEVLAEVAAILEEVSVAAGEAVFAKGDAGDSMYIIAEGRMRVADGERTVGELRPGDVFGELALLDPEPRLFTVAALEDSRLLRLDRDAFLELMAGNIEIVRGVLHVLCERLRQAESETAAERR
jgi:HEAT repeat protein